MLDRWIQPGQFSLELPANWSVKGLGEVTELFPDRGDAAIQISIYKKKRPVAAESSEAQQLVKNFAEKNGLKKKGDLSSSKIGAAWSSSAKFFIEGSASMPAVWIVRAVTDESRGLLSSLCADELNSDSYLEGERIL